MKSFLDGYSFLSFFLRSSLIPACAPGATYSLYLRYQPAKDFPSLQQKIGSNLGIAPFKDERSDTLYIGHHTSLFWEFELF